MIAENTGVSYKILTVSATDIDSGDNGTVRYKIKHDDNSFSIDKNSGEIRTKMNLDRETKDRHQLKIEAYDLGTKPLRSTVAMVIHVSDVNDNTPIITSPQFINSINESTAVNTKLAVVKADDRDIGINADLRYRVVTEGNKQIVRINASKLFS